MFKFEIKTIYTKRWVFKADEAEVFTNIYGQLILAIMVINTLPGSYYRKKNEHVVGDVLLLRWLL